MRVAALYDIHGMLTPLRAVLDEVDDTDLIVVGGDVASGPQPSETLELLRGLGDRVRWVRGNGDRELSTGGTGDYAPAVQRSLAWTAERLSEEQRTFLGALAETVVLDVDGLGEVCFCHATPRSDEEIVTQATPDRHLRKVLARAKESVVVVADSRSPRDGKFIEIVGRYNPQTEPSTIEFDEEKVKAWLGKGVQPSGTVARLLKIRNLNV